MSVVEETSASKRARDLKVQLIPVDVNNVGRLKVLLEAILPVSYGETFFRKLFSSSDYPSSVIQLANTSNVAIGCLCCRLDKENAGGPAGAAADPDAVKNTLYIMTLGVLDAYRGRGVGTHMLKYILAEAKKLSGVKFVALHVQTSNDAAVRFYERHGFSKAGRDETYYTKAEPRSAFIMRIEL